MRNNPHHKRYAPTSWAAFEHGALKASHVDDLGLPAWAPPEMVAGYNHRRQYLESTNVGRRGRRHATTNPAGDQGVAGSKRPVQGTEAPPMDTRPVPDS